MNHRGAMPQAVIVGAGPNGLAAAITLAQAGRSVHVIEAEPTIGGGSRSAALTLPGFLHDVCSAIHPMGRASPFFRSLRLDRFGLRWIEPAVQLAHPLDDGETGFLMRDLHETASGLGRDGRAYLELIGPLVRRWELIFDELAGPFHVPLNPRKAVAAATFGLRAIQPSTHLARRFSTATARALLAGCAAHSMFGLTEPLSGAFGLVFLASAHAVGWPVPAGGSQAIADALAAQLVELGGTLETGRRIERFDELPGRSAVLFDVTPRQVLAIAGEQFRHGLFRRLYAHQLRHFRYGPGVFKLDLALAGPIPWRDSRILRAATVHLGGTLEEITRSEDQVRRRIVPDHPFVLLAQPSLIDPSRAPVGKHTVWAYCHVPNGPPVDMTDRILAQVERFAPGTRDRILALAAAGPADLERRNANHVGGEIAGGLLDARQLFTRPAIRFDPYTTPDPRIFLCSSSTPPGAGVHGLCGWYGARSALKGWLRS